MLLVSGFLPALSSSREGKVRRLGDAVAGVGAGTAAIAGRLKASIGLAAAGETEMQQKTRQQQQQRRPKLQQAELGQSRRGLRVVVAEGEAEAQAGAEVERLEEEAAEEGAEQRLLELELELISQDCLSEIAGPGAATA